MTQYPIVVVKEDKGRRAKKRRFVVEVRCTENESVVMDFSCVNGLQGKAKANSVEVNSKPNKLEYEIQFGPDALGARKRKTKKPRSVS
jgi:hypothetical protein